MHREISHQESAFESQRPVFLYALTALLGLLIALDLMRPLGTWLGVAALTRVPRELFGFRFALIAAVLGGARTLYGSLDSLLGGKIGADLALALACVAAIFMGEPLVAAEVVFIGMVGECLEAFTFDRTQRAIRKLVEVFPRRCWRLRGGQEERIFVHELQVGDVVLVKPGGKVPADGMVREGRSALDTSHLTGESLPLDKGPGDDVLAGSINQFGALTIEAVKVGEQTVAGRVIELTAMALADKGPSERTADRWARWFLPIVLSLAAATFLVGMLRHFGGWGRGPDDASLSFWSAARLSMYPTLAVLVVACPCALILATPAAVIAALGRLAGTGILIKGGSALERLARVQAFAFDKTGTITEGRLEAGDILCDEGVSADDLLRLAASAEQNSEHPLARLIVDQARARGLAIEPIEGFQAHPGAGVEAALPSGKVVVGTRRLLEEEGIALAPGIGALLEQLDAGGQSALLVAHNGRVLGAMGARDRVRPEAENVLRSLQEAGVTPIMLLTGDRRAAADAVGKPLGFDQIEAELLPEQKAEFVRKLQEHKPVAMVGDGINDAPALARASVGLAIGSTGSDLAAEAGDIVLMGSPLRSLPLLFRLARQTVHIIHQNILYFALIVNIVGIVATAWLWPIFAPNWVEQSPLAAVIYHQFGSFLVLLNSMRLLWFERSGESAWLRGAKAGFENVDRWIDKHLDVASWFHEAGHHWKKVSVVLAILALLIYFVSGIRIIRPDEVAVQLRFGRPVADLAPGFHWGWPWPIEETVRVSQRLRTVSVGYRESPDKAKTSDSWTWSSPHRKDRVEEEALMITGDGNLVDVQAVVRYEIAQPRSYLFEVRGADEILRASTEAVLRQLVASRTFLELLTVGRLDFQKDAQARLEAKLAEYQPKGLGIRIEGVSLLDLHPPGEVVASYYKVAQAMEERDTAINIAGKDAIRELKAAEAEQVKIAAQAEIVKTEKVTRAQAELLRFEGLTGARKPHPELTDFRHYWDVVGMALKGRELLLIDADKLPGQRDLLIDPEQFRPILTRPWDRPGPDPEIRR